MGGFLAAILSHYFDAPKNNVVISAD